MALSPLSLMLIFAGLFVFTFVAYLFSGRMRSFLEISLIFDFVIAIFVLFLGFFNVPDNVSLIIYLFTPILGLLLISSRFNKHIKNPYNKMNAANQRILNENDLSTQTSIKLAKKGDLEEIKQQQDEIIEKLAITVGTIKEKITAIDSVNNSMGNRTSSMREEVTEITNDFDQILQAASILSENILTMQDQMINFLDRSESEFNKISSLVQSADRLSDQTNLVAVNAAIEASHSVADTNFNTVAEGIQRLSGRTRENTDRMYQSVIAMKRQINKEIEALSTQLNNLENTIIDLGDVSNRSSSFTHQQIIFTQELDSLISEIDVLSREIMELVETFKI